MLETSGGHCRIPSLFLLRTSIWWYASVASGATADQLLCSAAQSRRSIARALRVFADEANLPCVVHCIHGKVRTTQLLSFSRMGTRVCQNTRKWRPHERESTGATEHPGCWQDRTGLIIALLLLLLGVDEAITVLDYSKSEAELMVRPWGLTA